MNSFISSLFFFILALGVLITVHEFGHFWVARRLGVKVLRFSIGFGKPLWKWHRAGDETEYVLAALPLGGYVQMLDEREGPVAQDELPKAFNRQGLGRRFAIVAAGPLFNFLLAMIAYWLMFMVGISGMKPLLGDVAPGSPAARADLHKGDLIISIGQQPIATWNTAFLALMEEGMDGGTIRIVVQDDAHIRHQRVLDLRGVAEAGEQSDLLANLGLQPYTPVIPPVIGRLEAGGPAIRAGLQVDDRVVAVDGIAIQDWGAWVAYIRAHPDQLLHVSVARGRDRLSLNLRPQSIHGANGTIGRIGAAVKYPEKLLDGLSAVEHYSPLASVGKAVERTWHMSLLTVRMLWKMVVGDVSLDNLGGPIRIAQYAGASASAGFISFIGFLALISISLGVLNLLPIPVLDGGHLFYYLIELLKGSPVSDSTQAFGQRIGIIILIGVMALAFYNDLMQLFG